MRVALVLVALVGCGGAPSTSRRVEHPVCFYGVPDAYEQELKAETELVIAQVQRVANESYRRWAGDQPIAECPADPRELFQFTSQSDVDTWGTLLRIECTVVSSHIVTVRVQSAGPDQAFDTNDDVSTQRPFREGDSR